MKVPMTKFDMVHQKVSDLCAEKVKSGKVCLLFSKHRCFTGIDVDTTCFDLTWIRFASGLAKVEASSRHVVNSKGVIKGRA